MSEKKPTGIPGVTEDANAYEFEDAPWIKDRGDHAEIDIEAARWAGVWVRDDLEDPRFVVVEGRGVVPVVPGAARLVPGRGVVIAPPGESPGEGGS